MNQPLETALPFLRFCARRHYDNHHLGAKPGFDSRRLHQKQERHPKGCLSFLAEASERVASRIFAPWAKIQGFIGTLCHRRHTEQPTDKTGVRFPTQPPRLVGLPPSRLRRATSLPEGGDQTPSPLRTVAIPKNLCYNGCRPINLNL